MEQIKIGWGRREISTAAPVSIPGQHYIRVSEGILDPLYATALCIDGGEGQDAVIFCSLDMTSLRVIAETVLARTAEKYPEIPNHFISINVTHTHTSCAPTPQPERSEDGKEIYPAEKWVEFCADQAADAIAEAWHSRKPGGIAYGYGYAVVAHSRRVLYSVDKSLGAPPGMNSNGYAVMYGKTDDPDFASYEAGADHFVNLLYTFDAQKRLSGMVINIPCPSQTSEHLRMLSSDYWNEVRENVAAEYGPDVYVLPQCAAAGDLSPRILHYHKAQERRMALKYGMGYDTAASSRYHAQDFFNKSMAERRDIAERILYAVREVYAWASKEIFTELPVVHRAETLQLKYRLITEEEKKQCEQNLASAAPQIPEGASEQERAKAVDLYRSRLRRNNTVIRRYEEQDPDVRFPMKTHVIRIGDVAFATNCFEYYMDYMHRIQARSPFVQTFIVQLSGETSNSYLPTARGIENRGYGSSMYEDVIGAEGGQQIVEETLRILKEIR